MIKPNDYDTAEAFKDFPKLPVGGYICRIIELTEVKSKAENDMIRVALDIADGYYTGFYSKKFREDNRKEKKWSCYFYSNVRNKDGSTNGGFKAFVEAVRESNAGFEPSWDSGFAESFKGKLVGMVFGEEEYLNADGEIRDNVKPVKAKSVEAIRNKDYTIPSKRKYNSSRGAGAPLPEGFTAIGDDDIPF